METSIILSNKAKLGLCAVCKEPLYGGPNQRVRFHKACRKEGRQRFGKSTGNKEIVWQQSDRKY